MDKFGKTLILVFALFIMFLGLHMALRLGNPYIRRLAPELADMLSQQT